MSEVSSMERELENPKGNIYGVARQNNFIFPRITRTAASDSCGAGPARLGWKAGSVLTACVTPGSNTWLHTGVTWGALKVTMPGTHP